MKIKQRELFSNIILITIILGFIMFFLPIKQAFERDVFITTQFLAIGFISIYGIIGSTKRNSFSLSMIIFFFFFTFIFCGGFTQFGKDMFKWGLEPTLDDLRYANFIIIIFELSFLIARKSKKKIKIGHIYKSHTFWNKKIDISSFSITPISIILFVIGIYTILSAGWRVLLIREVFSVSGIVGKINSTSIQSLVAALIRGLATWGMMITVANFMNKRNLSNLLCFLFSFIVAVINIPPTGVARYVVAAVYGGLFIYLFDFVKQGRNLLYILAIGLLFIFPLLNTFRGNFTDEISLSLIQKSLGNITENFTRADYDAYSMIVFSVQYVRQVGISWGYQLLGTVLFFIPSSLWKSKPGGSGATIIEYMNTGYNSNVSCPIVAEAYINFGLIGVIIFAMFIGYITKLIDDCYWAKWKDEICLGNLLYCFLIPFTLFMCRGDLLSTFSYLSGYFISLLVLVKVSKIIHVNFKLIKK